MRKDLLGAALLVGSCTLLVAGTASAANYTLLVHGRNTSGVPTGFSYWADHTGYNVSACTSYVTDDHGMPQCNSNPGYATPVAVNYDGSAHISTTNPGVTAAMTEYCSGGNSCYILCHSAGCSQVGYTVANTATPTGGWHINWVRNAGSAAGGSELANAGSWLTGYAIDSDLHTSTMRGMYNHDLLGDRTGGNIFTYLGGDWSSITNMLFTCHSSFFGVCYSTAANDSVIAFHSSGHQRSVSGAQSVSCSGGTGGSCWDYTHIAFEDNGSNGNYGHCLVAGFLGSCQENYKISANGGIVEKAAADVRSLAK